MLAGMTPDRFTPQVEARVNDLSDEADGLAARIADLEAQEQRNANAATVRKQGNTGTAYVTRGAEVYRPEDEHSFFRDVYTARQGDWAAAERLHRNNALHGPESRAGMTTTTGTGGEFAPPLWLVEQFVPWHDRGA
jgi:HK97 family phage major capsid protein